MKAYDTYEKLSRQDYGPWVDEVSLFEKKGQFFLLEQSGYGNPLNKQWYQLDKKPESSLAEAFSEVGGLFCGGGPKQGEVVFSHALKVTATSCDKPDLS